jgi:surface antigen
MRTLINSATKRLALTAIALPMLTGCASASGDEEESVGEATDEISAAAQANIASIAMANVGGTACGLNSEGGYGFYSSCTGNGGQPEYWCSDFAKWVWNVAGADVGGLTPAAGTFYCYGQNKGTLSNTPHVGDAVVFNYQGNCWADHVALVTQVNPDGKIVAVSGNWGGKSGSQAYFSSTSKVTINQPAFPGVVGTTPGVIGMKISGFISPTGIPDPPPPPPPAEGSQAFLYPNQQHFVNSDGLGNIRHHWWDASTQSIITDTWGTGTAGQPVAFVHGTSQHVFARGTDGSLKHWFWDPFNGPRSDNWAPTAGLIGDPAAIVIGDFEAVWAIDQNKNLRHWFWGPNTNGVQSDTWGSGVVGRPSVFVTSSGEQHAFARGISGTLEHWWWAPGGGVSHDTWGSGLAGDPTALAFGEFQAVWAVDGAGNLQHWYWGPNTNGVQHDTWGSGVVGRPSVFVTSSGEQHAFVRGKFGALEHWWWAPNAGILHDTWGSGITRDPTALVINNQQHVWALDAGGYAKHWFWDPATNVINQDSWGK